MEKEHILVIEDEEDILELVKFNLEAEGYRVSTAMSGEKGLSLARAHKPVLLLLDLMLPGMNGLEVCKSLKSDPDTRGILVAMLTAKGEESDVVVGLELGADDYITKPFSPRVLVARVRALLRRREDTQEAPASQDRIIKVHEMEVHPGRREVLLKGKPLDLTTTEFDLLYFLARRPGWVFTRQQILEAVRGEDAIVTDRAVDVQVVGLRKKLGKAGKLIETVRGVGYRFRE
jgi:two-component system phosphate regulon response regulator PhoB